MDIKVSALPLGTLSFRIFDDNAEFGKNPFILSGLIIPDQHNGCEIANVQGDMSNEANELMAITVRDLGFDYLTFRTLKGSRVSRYATYTHSDDCFDFYWVPLKGQTTHDGR